MLRTFNPNHNMSFAEVMNAVGGRDSYSSTIQTEEGRIYLLTKLDVDFADIFRLAKLDAVVSLLMNAAENDNSENLKKG